MARRSHKTPCGESHCCSGCEKRIIRGRLLSVFAFSTGRLDDICNHIRKRFIARHGCQNLLAGNRVGARPTSCVDCHSIDELSVDFCLEPAKTNIRNFMVATSSGAAGPMNCEELRVCTHFFVESLGKRDCAALRFDKGQIAIIGADASNQTTHKGRGARRKLPEQRFAEKLRDAIGWNIWNNCILSCTQANRAVAILVSETREFVKLLRIDSAGGNAETKGHKPGPFLRG